MNRTDTTTFRYHAAPIAAACLFWAAHAAAAPLPPRPLMAPGTTSEAVPAQQGAQRQVPPAGHMLAPYKPLNLSNPSAGIQQSTVQWTVPDQSNGRVIWTWVVRACPAGGSSYVACQSVPGPSAGQSSGTTVQAQISSHILYMGASTPVNAAEVCASNSVNINNPSCADRIAVRFINPGAAPAPVRAPAPAQMRVRPAPR